MPIIFTGVGYAEVSERGVWMMLRGFLAIALMGAGSVAAVAQMSMAGHDMGSMKEIPAPEKLPVPVRMTGIGNSHIAIKGTRRRRPGLTRG